jgi:hypothetical protein
MKKLFVIVGVLVFNVFSYAQQIINDPNAEKRTVTGFHSIDVSGGIDLYLSQGQEAVAVSAADAKFPEKIKTGGKDGVLRSGMSIIQT